MSEFKPVPLNELPEGWKLEDIAESVTEAVRTARVQESLRQRGFRGALNRYSGSVSDSLQALQRGLEEAEKQGLGIYPLLDLEKRSFGGLATTKVGLPLYHPRVPLPVRYTRNPILGKRMATPAVHVAAWAALPGMQSGTKILIDAYSGLQEIAPNSWTAELQYPRNDDTVHHPHGAIRLSGYQEQVRARLDDMEYGRPDSLYRRAPKAVLYFASQEPEG